MRRYDENGVLLHCKIEGCDRPVKARGLCTNHYGKAFDYNDHERKRRWEKAHRLPCPNCGAPMAAGTMKADGSPAQRVKRNGRVRLCRECRRAEQRGGRSARRAEIQRLWDSGLMIREIAEELDTTSNTIGVEMARMRKDGWKLEYRYGSYRNTAHLRGQ